MTWTQRLKRVFGVDLQTSPAGGGAVRIIACIEAPAVIEKLLTHLDVNGGKPEATRRAPGRAPPQGGCSTRRGKRTMTSFDLCRQRRGKGVACPDNRRAGETGAGESVSGVHSGA